MPLPKFTLDESVTIYDILGDVSGSELSPSVLTSATVTFRSNVPEDRFVTWEGNLYRVPPVTAKVTADGTPGVSEITLSTPQVVNPGLYWIGGAVQNAPTTQPTMRVVSSPLMPGGPLGTTLPTLTSLASMAKSGITGAFGAIAAPVGSTVPCPRIGFRVA
ncbi:hypothetical protein NIIDNTM18_42080 [Mycolicibacterium litorale]|uniref:Uncharacterized protein n=1 Tax=Mycolicibacterium litorale TaxID=758802 RepID=A0A6S6PE59_9MYCO|nr:hypothetical protein NIIDNTM18_42080 [Mycolicibacterium litorale]